MLRQRRKNGVPGLAPRRSAVYHSGIFARQRVRVGEVVGGGVIILVTRFRRRVVTRWRRG